MTSTVSILDTGKDGYSADAEFDARTRAAVKGEESEWGDPENLFERDAVEVLEFVTGDYHVVARILAGLKRYTLLDLGCGYGRLAPLLTAFDCREYVGIDRVSHRFDLARTRFERTGAHRMIGFGCGDVLRTEITAGLIEGGADVVWTSNVLQHLTVPDKLRLVETMKACRARGGICLLREEGIETLRSRAQCEELYAQAHHAKHMIPVPFDELAAAFRPLRLTHAGGNVWMAREE